MIVRFFMWMKDCKGIIQLFKFLLKEIFKGIQVIPFNPDIPLGERTRFEGASKCLDPALQFQGRLQVCIAWQFSARGEREAGRETERNEGSFSWHLSCPFLVKFLCATFKSVTVWWGEPKPCFSVSVDELNALSTSVSRRSQALMDKNLVQRSLLDKSCQIMIVYYLLINQLTFLPDEKHVCLCPSHTHLQQANMLCPYCSPCTHESIIFY